MKKLIGIILLSILSQSALAIEWELKNKFKFRDGERVTKLEYEDDGSFDKQKVKEKNSFKSEMLLTASGQTQMDNLEWVGRLGYKFERKNDYSVQLKEDGSIKKDKSRVEYKRTQLVGLGAVYKIRDLLGSQRWVLKTHVDSFFNIEYDAGHIAEDTKSFHGRNSGYEFRAKFSGEYSTTSNSFYVIPMFDYRHRYAGHWVDSVNEKNKDAELEQRTEVALYLNWVLPIDGFELIIGPMWQRENEAEQPQGESWDWQDEERVYAHVMLEYEEPNPGFELELEVEHVVRGHNINDSKIMLELSYEF